MTPPPTINPENCLAYTLYTPYSSKTLTISSVTSIYTSDIPGLEVRVPIADCQRSSEGVEDGDDTT